MRLAVCQVSGFLYYRQDTIGNQAVIMV